MKLYTLYDKVQSEIIQDVFIAKNEQTAVRLSVNTVIQRFPLKDIDLLEIGEIKENGTIIPQKPKIIKWSCYKMPEDRAEALAPLGANVKKIEKEIERHKMLDKN